MEKLKFYLIKIGLKNLFVVLLIHFTTFAFADTLSGNSKTGQPLSDQYGVLSEFESNALSDRINQEITVSGKVTSMEDKQSIPGVNVVIKGTTTGTVTDVDGNYSIRVPNTDAVLVFSYIGYISEEIVVNNRSVINVGLSPDIRQLTEVVIIGYGEVDRRDLTTSVSSINSRQIKDIPINSAAEALTGRLAGVQITSTEGSPYAEVLIRVRGGGSITQDNSPLYVVDGIQVENALSVISPQDIESVDVLKDASATAIYGARGANGVVIITTKGGKEMKTQVNYNGLVGVRNLANKLEMMKPYDFVKYQYERSRGSTANEQSFLNTYGHYGDIENYRQVPFVDWQEEVFGRSAVMQTHNISIVGGTAVTKFNLSATSNVEEGIMLGSDFDRKLINFKFNHDISKRVKTGFNVRYNHTVVNGAGTSVEGSSSVNRLRHSVKYRPIVFPGQDLDTYDPEYADQTNANSLALVNPILLTEAEYRKRIENVANISGSFTYNITDYLDFTSTFGVDIFNRRDNEFNDSITSQSRLNGGRLPIAYITTVGRNSLNNSNVITFNASKLNTSFSTRNKLTFMVGHEVYEVTERENELESRFFPSGISPERALGSMELGEPERTQSEEFSSTLLSFFSRLNYSFDDKYLVGISMRADGSSKFAKGNKWGYFPSVSLAWRISNESFLEGAANILSDLRLRASYGEAGNNRITDFLYLTQFGPSRYYSLNNNQVVGYGPSSLANENLVWETTISQNLGLDIAFLNDRIRLSADAYYNETSDLLVEVPVPTTSGYRTQIQNIGNTSNRGIEVQLAGTLLNNRNFTWNSNFNISFNKNRVESLGDQIQSFTVSSQWSGSNTPHDYTIKKGYPVGSMWGLITDGFYTIDDFNYEDGVYTLKEGVPNNQSITAIAPQPGVLKFKDLTDDNLVNDQDRTVIGDATPKFFGGWNHQFTFLKNWDLSVFLNFQYGNDVLNANKLEFSSGYTPNSNLLSMMNDRWRNVNAEGQVVRDPEALAQLNANATIWSPLTSASSFYSHSWAVEDGSFIRINNVTLGYSLPKSLLSALNISNVRLYGTVNNLAVFTNYSGYDPEVNTRRRTPMTPGVDYSAYPRSRAFIFGANVTF